MSTRQFFIVSTGRSGTTTLARLLSQAPNCTCLHEPKPRFVREAPLYHYGKLDGSHIAMQLRETRPVVQSELYGESSHKLSLLIPVLHDIFPDARFVWLIRDGRDVVSSSVARGLYYPVEKKMAEHPNRPDHMFDWTRFRLSGSEAGEISSDRWNQMSRFEKNCWRWSYINRTIAESISHFDLPHRTIYLENLLPEIRSIALWLGVAEPLTGFKVERHNATAGERRSWRDWTTEERNTFERWCAELMDNHYPDWRDERGTWQTVSKATHRTLSVADQATRVRQQMGAYSRKVYRRVKGLVG